jgi:Ran-binding protein 9/10
LKNNLTIKKKEKMEEEIIEEENLLNIKERGNFIKIEKDMLTVKYIGQGVNQHDYGTIRAIKGFKGNKLIDYFETTIMEEGDKSMVIIGLSIQEFSLSKYPGYDSKSYGFGSDGKKYYNMKDKGKEYGPTFGKKNDVIGCGINYIKSEIFFTKNGKYLGLFIFNHEF